MVVCVRRVTVSRSPNIACILLSEKETESGFDVRKEVPQSEVPPPALLVRHRRWSSHGHTAGADGPWALLVLSSLASLACLHSA